ncbi:MAG: VOC family protein [Candidatus Angelobacter sp. Gp1-AA117]|nr:MAG: VOC family protein [Candidatus Angelobacter sp. Gp1-AA117]
MLGINAHIAFDGNCAEAMRFYADCLGAELHLMPFSETPCNAPKEAGDRIAHARLTKGPALLMGSDTIPGMPFARGANNFTVNISCESLQEIEQFFSALSKDGKVTMALQDTFWGARFGMLTDRFGVNWMFNFELPKK